MKDKMDNRGINYSNWNPPKYSWGTLFREMETQREQEREGNRIHCKPSKMNKKGLLLNTSAVASDSQNK